MGHDKFKTKLPIENTMGSADKKKLIFSSTWEICKFDKLLLWTWMVREKKMATKTIILSIIIIALVIITVAMAAKLEINYERWLLPWKTDKNVYLDITDDPQWWQVKQFEFGSRCAKHLDKMKNNVNI